MTSADEETTIARCRRDGHAYVLIDGVRVRVELHDDCLEIVDDGSGTYTTGAGPGPYLSSDCGDDQCGCGGDLRRATAEESEESDFDDLPASYMVDDEEPFQFDDWRGPWLITNIRSVEIRFIKTENDAPPPVDGIDWSSLKIKPEN